MSTRPPTQPPPPPPRHAPSCPDLSRLKLGADLSRLKLGGASRATTGAKRDPEGLPLDESTFLADARLALDRARRSTVYDEDVMLMLNRLIDRGEWLAEKRQRPWPEAADLWWRFDPTDDVDEAIERWELVQSRIDMIQDAGERDAAQDKLDSAIPLVHEFLSDQYTGLVVVVDVETTTLASEPIENLQASVCTVLGFDQDRPDDPERTLTHSFWHAEARRLPMELVTSTLENATWIVAFNGNFDLSVLKKELTSVTAYDNARAKLLDPYVAIKRERGLALSLGTLLGANPQLGAAKDGSGKAAPNMWTNRQWATLLAYNQQDCNVLKTLVLAPALRLPTSDGRLEQTSAAALSVMIAKATSTDPRDFVQGSAHWHAYRRQGARVTASLAPALLGFSPFLRPTEAFGVLLGEVMPSNVHTARGNREEAKIADAFARRMRLRLHEVGIYPHPQFAWLAASPDRLVVASGEVVEIKSTAGAPTLTASHILQLTLQLACTGARIGYLVGQQFGKRDLVAWKIQFDVELFRAMVELLEPLHAAAANAVQEGTEDETEMPQVPPLGLQELNVLLEQVKKFDVSKIL